MRLAFEQIALLSLLRCALGTAEVGPTLILCSDISLPEWQRILALAGQQTVTGLVYQAVSKFPPHVRIPEDAMMTLAVKSARIERRSGGVQKQAEAIVRGLEKAGLSPVLMKGPAVAAYYPQPLLRESGDIDLYFAASELPSALVLFKEKGYFPQATPDGSHYCEDRPAGVDIHGRYFDLHVPDRHLPPVPSPDATLLMLMAHILKHAMGPGVGLRQLCDLAMAFRALDGSYDKENFRRICRLCGIERWAMMLCSFIQEGLGVAAGIYPAAEPYDSLCGIVFRGGDFGHHSPWRQSALTSSAWQRKADTALRFIRRAPFGLQYAPREYFHRLGELVSGNWGAMV